MPGGGVVSTRSLDLGLQTCSSASCVGRVASHLAFEPSPELDGVVLRGYRWEVRFESANASADTGRGLGKPGPALDRGVEASQTAGPPTRKPLLSLPPVG